MREIRIMAQPTDSIANDEVRSMLYAAHKGNESYQQTKSADNRAPEEQEKTTHFKVHSAFRDALELRLPQFFLKATSQGLFGGEEERLLTRESLWKGLTLRDKDTQIDFGSLAADIMPRILRVPSTKRRRTG